MNKALPATSEQILKQLVVVVPAFNEEASLGGLLAEIRAALPQVPILVVSDGSKDRTVDVARAAGVRVLDLPHNMGVGGAVQAGFQYAVRNGFGHVLRIWWWAAGSGRRGNASVRASATWASARWPSS